MAATFDPPAFVLPEEDEWLFDGREWEVEKRREIIRGRTKELHRNAGARTPSR